MNPAKDTNNREFRDIIPGAFYLGTARDRQIKLFRLSGAQNPPKSLTVRKSTVLLAQEELGRVLGHS